jgi:hypothetical protein
MLAHETAHVRARDNLKRFVLEVCADAMAFTPSGRRSRSDWIAASEDAADDAAAGGDAARALDLASALIKVAKLAPARGPAFIPSSALYRGEDIERRVRRLLRSRPAPERSQPGRWMLALSCGAVAALAFMPWLRGVYAALEAAVQYLP